MPTILRQTQDAHRKARAKMEDVFGKAKKFAEEIKRLEADFTAEEQKTVLARAEAISAGQDVTPATKRFVKLKADLEKRRALMLELEQLHRSAAAEERVERRALYLAEQKAEEDNRTELIGKQQALEARLATAKRAVPESAAKIAGFEVSIKELDELGPSGLMLWSGTLEQFNELIEDPTCTLAMRHRHSIATAWKGSGDAASIYQVWWWTDTGDLYKANEYDARRDIMGPPRPSDRMNLRNERDRKKALAGSAT